MENEIAKRLTAVEEKVQGLDTRVDSLEKGQGIMRDELGSNTIMTSKTLKNTEAIKDFLADPSMLEKTAELVTIVDDIKRSWARCIWVRDGVIKWGKFSGVVGAGGSLVWVAAHARSIAEFLIAVAHK